MKLFFRIGLAALTGATLAGSGAAVPSAQGVMQRCESAARVADVTASATLRTQEGNRADKVKAFTWWRKAASNDRFNTFTRFHSPPEIRGEAVLFRERDRDTNDVFLYLPSMKKIRRIESSSQRTSFMGSAFSYSDIATPHADDYEHKLLRMEPCPAEAATQCYVIESKPIDEKVRDRTGYSRLVEWIHGGHFMKVAAELYGEDGTLAKRMTASRIRKVDPENDKWMAQSARIEEVKRKRVTTLELDNLVVNGGIADEVFSQQNLRRE